MDVKTELNVFGKPTYKVQDQSKRKIVYEVYQPSNEFAMWKIKPHTGPVPAQLEGFYTSANQAIEVTKTFLRKIKPKNAPVANTESRD